MEAEVGLLLVEKRLAGEEEESGWRPLFQVDWLKGSRERIYLDGFHAFKTCASNKFFGNFSVKQ